MKISYRTAGAGSYTVLGDESDRTQSIRDYRPAMRGEAQVAALAFAASQFVAARANRVWTLGFAIERTHANLPTAVSFLATHPAALPDAVDLKIEQGSSAVYLAGAAWTAFEGRPEGVSSVCTYQFIGIYTATAP